MYTLRPYQKQASDAAVRAFTGKTKKNGLLILPTGAGKSLVIADIASRLNAPLLVFQPSKEILEQNFAKLQSYGIVDCGVYSASVGCKDINRITFATIGSVMNHMSDFAHFKNVMVDECFPYEQYVSTEVGKKKIGVLYKEFKMGKDIPLVLSYNSINHTLNKNKVLEIRKTGKKAVYKYYFCKKKFQATENHPVLTPNGFVPVGSLVEGNIILCTNKFGGHSFPIPNKDQIEFIQGSLLGDGNLDALRHTQNVNRIRFVQGAKQKEYLLWKAEMMNATNIQKVEHQGYSGTTIYRFNSPSMIIEDGICSKRMAIEYLTPKSLAVLYMDDGNLSIEWNKATICAVAESMELTELLVSKMRNFGIDCEVRQAKSSTTKKPYYYVGIRKEGVHTLCAIIAKYVHPSMAYKLIDVYKHEAGQYIWNNQFQELGGTVFLKKEYVGCKDVYNMEVENDHTYIICNDTHDKNHKTFDDGVIVHNCHLTNAKGGQYKTFFEAADRQVIGLTATPYRLARGLNGTSMLKFLTRTRPRIFDEVLYYCQITELLAKGYLADLQYFDCTQLDMSRVNTNSTGADYDDESLKLEYERSGFYDQLTSTTLRVLKPKSKIPRKGVLVFTRFIEEAEKLTSKLLSKGINAAIVTGKTSKREREEILEKFKKGIINVVSNVGTLTTGFDYPSLDTVILARPTKSLSLYYQMVGRAIRPFPGKEGWIIDLGGSYRVFGKVSDLKIDLEVPNSSRWCIKSLGKQLTNVNF